MSRLITLLTDFGTADGYVAELKGVLLTLAPGAVVVDVAHDVPAHDVESGRLALARYWRRFPPGTVHLAVVDPGVGGGRAAIAVASEERWLVGPDNGLLSPALLARSPRAVALTVPPGAAPTFHGRDLFAPAAAALARGEPLDALGVAHAAPVVRRTPEPHRREDGAVVGEVITVDRFGNAVTNFLGARPGAVEVNGTTLVVQRTYETAAPGALLAVCGSTGLVEIAVRDGSAAERLGLGRGSPVLFRAARH
jgi:S-adenosylmethionine hydrolase